jgi:hypothetical protein
LIDTKLIIITITETSTMGKKRVLVGFGVDIDAVAGWLGSYGGEDSTNDISRGGRAPARRMGESWLTEEQVYLPVRWARLVC